jgi:hypothetical protein
MSGEGDIPVCVVGELHQFANHRPIIPRERERCIVNASSQFPGGGYFLRFGGMKKVHIDKDSVYESRLSHMNATTRFSSGQLRIGCRRQIYHHQHKQ